MIKLITAALSIGLLGASPALATETPDPELKEHLFLVDVIEQLGVKVNFGGPVCRSKPGLYGNYDTNGSVMNLCEVGDREERLDTLRHEAWHLYQDIRNCSLADLTPLKPAFGSFGPSRAFVAHAAKHYQGELVPIEAEAAWAAHTFDATAIANLIIQRGRECGAKFKF